MNIYNFVLGAVVFGLTSYIPYYATTAYGMTPGQDGILLTPRSVAMIVMSTITSLFIIRFRYRLPMIIGQALIALSLLLLSRGFHDVSVLGVSLDNLVLLGCFTAIIGAGMGIANPAANNAALDLIPEKVAAVTGMRGMSRSVGGVLGTSAVSLVVSYFPDKAKGMQHIYTGFALMLLLLIPLVFLIPDTARERTRHIVHE